MLHTIDVSDWQARISADLQQQALTSLESGSVVFCPKLSFSLSASEQAFLATTYASPKTKNISFSQEKGQLQGAVCTKLEEVRFCRMLQRYSEYAKSLLNNLLPQYTSALEQGRTSFRPVEIKGRTAPSYRKDDTRLHVDAFPSTPTRGKRILRVFTNVNPNQQPRVWRLGAPFPQVVAYFSSLLKKPLPGSFFLLNLLKVTKNYRSPYDHYMLQLHDAMKRDINYQQEVPQMEFQFPAGSSWIVFTDQVSHAAMAGQFTFEQTFYLSPEALVLKEHAPCTVLEKFLTRRLL